MFQVLLIILLCGLSALIAGLFLSARARAVDKKAISRLKTDLCELAAQIKAQTRKFETIFDSMIEAVIILDKSGRIISVNNAFEKTFAVSKGEAAGRMFLEAIRNNDIWEIARNVISSGEPAFKEISLVLPVKRSFQINATPIYDANAAPGVSGCLAVLHDITQIRALEAMRKDFVANVSHELKTPLTSIKGFVETLIDGAVDDPENNRYFLKLIENNASRLNLLIEDLLSLSEIESGAAKLNLIEIDLGDLAQKILNNFRPQLSAKKINISFEPTHIKLKADTEKLERSFINLIDNAIKFNKDKGSIEITIERLDKKIKINIRDTGIGIPEKDIPRIFERFYRVDKARSRELGGTGLGLAIVKHIIEAHGGKIWVNSIEGQGSEFSFTLPQ